MSLIFCSNSRRMQLVLSAVGLVVGDGWHRPTSPCTNAAPALTFFKSFLMKVAVYCKQQRYCMSVF